MRLANVTHINRLQASVRDLHVDLAKTEEQISTGKVASVFSGLKGEKARVSVQLREVLSTRESYINTINTTKLRAEVASSALTEIQNLASDLRVELIKQTQDLYSENLPIMNEFAKTQIDRLANLLNSEVAGIFVFSGMASSTAPIINTETIKTNFAAGGGVNTAVNAASNSAATIQNNSNTWFNTMGNWNALGTLSSASENTVHAAVGLNVSYGEMANQEAFSDLFEILNIFANVTVAGGTAAQQQANQSEYRTLVDNSRGTVEQAFDDINQMVADLGGDLARLNSIQEKHKNDIELVTSQLDNVENVDSFEAINRFQSLRSQIESSYQITAASRGFSLLNFLN
ncbi:MAG: hypothetical protein CMM58_09720 [Rhodospirillaceae bacterium]|nr:hypothetical protein [Rhodospirillaceae bacterium]|tara:strand:- start:2424 stop:3458 length:1035 start_codon:yes stop_codon:yes gene_type:complete